MPKSQAVPWTVYDMATVGKVGILSDIHCPYHDDIALRAAVDHLHEQLSGVRLNDAELRMAELIIGNLNDDGYLMLPDVEGSTNMGAARFAARTRTRPSPPSSSTSCPALMSTAICGAAARRVKGCGG